MKNNITRLGLTFGLFTAISVLFITVIPLITEPLLGRPYGSLIRSMVTDIYPWYENGKSIFGVIAGIIWGFIDGFICGALIAWIYNKVGNK